ncbi:MAG: hypothetical protein M3341_05640 [Actinomycetota bacterium]|nr:hypothetical protein [Actinomycetota bacterium]
MVLFAAGASLVVIAAGLVSLVRRQSASGGDPFGLEVAVVRRRPQRYAGAVILP